MSATEYCSD